MNQPTPHNHVAIIGTGFGAIAAAVRLQQSGIENFVLIERAGDVGGVWRDNAYPGAAVDVKSHLYSLSFAPNPDWRHVFAKQPELHAYLNRVVDDFDLRHRLMLNTEVTSLQWVADEQRWHLSTSNGERTATHVVVATGALAEPVIPNLPGLDKFEGEQFHSARWNHEFDLTGKKVAVIGTGASAIQFVPAIQPQVGKLTLFQRTAPWIMPRHDHEVSSRRRALFRKFPALQRLERTRSYFQFEWMILAFRNPSVMRVPQRRALKHLKTQVPDPVLRAKLNPDYRIGCKRILLSDNYLPTLSQPNVDVNTDGVREIRAHSIIDNQGVEHEVDAIIFGTGFDTRQLPLTDRLIGTDGISMAEHWDGDPAAYLGTAVHGFPNCYLMHGPNIGLGHNSVIQMLESQANYIASAVSYARDFGFAAVEPTQEAQQQYDDDVQRLSEGTVWTAGGCQSWYVNSHGRNVNIWPSSTIDYRRRTSSFNPSDHVVRRPARESPAEVAELILAGARR